MRTYWQPNTSSTGPSNVKLFTKAPSPDLAQLQSAIEGWRAPAELNTALPRAARFTRRVRWSLGVVAAIAAAFIVGAFVLGYPDALDEIPVIEFCAIAVLSAFHVMGLPLTMFRMRW